MTEGTAAILLLESPHHSLRVSKRQWFFGWQCDVKPHRYPAKILVSFPNIADKLPNDFQIRL